MIPQLDSEVDKGTRAEPVRRARVRTARPAAPARRPTTFGASSPPAEVIVPRARDLSRLDHLFEVILALAACLSLIIVVQQAVGGDGPADHPAPAVGGQGVSDAPPEVLVQPD